MCRNQWVIPGRQTPVISGCGALEKIGELIRQLGLTGRGIGVWEDDTFRRVVKRPKVFRNVLFDDEQLFCDSQAIEYLRKQSVEEGDYFIAVGGEALQSVTKILAKESDMPYIAVPSCAFGLGMASSAAVLDTESGPCRAEGAEPAAVVIDTQIIAEANESIALGAIQELVRYAGLTAYRRAGAIAAGYRWDEELTAQRQRAMDAAFRTCNGLLRRKKPEAFESLCRALIVCGVSEEAGEMPLYPARLHFLSEHAEG